MILETIIGLTSTCCIIQYIMGHKTKEENLKDELTGMYNRKIMKIIKNQDENNPKDVIAFDIDHFKNINDTYGHHIGDIVLQSVSKIIQNNFSKNDVCVRFGGEEFFTFVDSKSHEDENYSYKKAEIIRKEIENMRVLEDGNLISVTISIGISNNKNISLSQRIESSDKLLYKSKTNGRNQTNMEIEYVN